MQKWLPAQDAGDLASELQVDQFLHLVSQTI